MLPSRRNRAIAALAIAAGYGLLTHYRLTVRGPGIYGSDFTYPWLAARFTLHGVNPYDAMKTATTPFQQVYFYPLWTAILVVPFVVVTAHAAAVWFMSV